MNYNDLTVVIPVRIDSDVRLHNLELTLGKLQELEGLTILVLEADVESRLKHIQGVKKIFVHDDNPYFHRTKYINVLCSETQTPYLGVWDADVIAPVAQVERGLQLLRSGEADMVFPFDGHCYDVNQAVKQEYGMNRQEEVLFSHIGEFGLIWSHFSCGGAFMVNRAAYIAAGGENERFYCWGPEDVERYKRWEIGGYRTLRTDGPLFHLSHPRHDNSKYTSDEVKIQMMKILFETCRKTAL